MSEGCWGSMPGDQDVTVLDALTLGRVARQCCTRILPGIGSCPITYRDGVPEFCVHERAAREADARRKLRS